MSQRVETRPRKRPRQARSQATVDAILTATAQVLVEDGYDRATTNRIARRAGVSVGSVYQYFPNKEALVGELVEQLSDEILAMVTGALEAAASEPPEVMVPRLVGAMIAFKRRDPRLSRVLRDQIPRVGRMQLYESHLARIVDAVARYLAGHRARLKHDDPEAMAFVAVHVADAATHQGVTQPDAVALDVLEAHVCDLLLSYLVARPQG